MSLTPALVRSVNLLVIIFFFFVLVRLRRRAPEKCVPEGPEDGVTEPPEAPAPLPQAAKEALLAGLRRRGHGLEVGQGGLLDEGVPDGDLVPARVVGRGRDRRWRMGRREEVAEARVGG